MYEGYGLPVIEAISNKCPVLISNISVFKEITNNNAHFVNPNSAMQMSKLLYKISTDKNFANLHVLNAFNFVKKRTWKNVSEETNEVYKYFL